MHLEKWFSCCHITVLPTNSYSFALHSRLNKLLQTRKHTNLVMRKHLTTPSASLLLSQPSPQTSLTSTKNSKGKTRANTLQRIQRKGWKRSNVCSGGTSPRPHKVVRVSIRSENVDRVLRNTSCLLSGNKLQYKAACGIIIINKVYIQGHNFIWEIVFVISCCCTLGRLRAFDYIVTISFGCIFYCVCFNLYCGGFILFCTVCVCVDFVMCVCVCVCGWVL